MSLEEKMLESEQVYQGDFLRLMRDRVLLPDGQVATREYCVHPGAVAIIPVLPDGRLVLERQYRYSVRREMIEFPAGKRDAGEAALECGVRELHEETGYRAGRWARAGVIHPVIGYSTEAIDIWLATDLHAGTSVPDPGEFVEVFTATAQEVDAWILSGSLTDAKTISCMYWLKAWQCGEWVPDWVAPHAS